MWPRALVGWLFGGVLLSGLLFYGAVEPVIYYPLFLLLLVSALLATWSLPLQAFGAIRFFPLLLVGLFLLAGILIQETLIGRGYLISALGWLALILTLALTTSSERTARWLFIFLILVGGAEAVYGLYQSLGGHDYIGGYHRGYGRLATGTLINRNHFAGLLNMTLPLAVGWLLANYSRRGRKAQPRSELYAWVWVILLSCSFMGLAIFLSLSRAGTLTLVSTLVFISLLLTLKRRSRSRRSLSGTTAWILLFVIVSLATWVGLDALLSRFGGAGSDWNGRRTVFQDSLQLVAENPELGIGPAMYQWRFRPFQTQSARVLFSYAHNDYLQSAIEWGIPGALLFWGFVAWRFYRSVLVFFQSHRPWRQGIALGCSGAILAILLHSLIDFNLQIPGNLMIFCTILGLSWGTERNQKALLPKPQREHPTP